MATARKLELPVLDDVPGEAMTTVPSPHDFGVVHAPVEVPPRRGSMSMTVELVSGATFGGIALGAFVGQFFGPMGTLLVAVVGAVFGLCLGIFGSERLKPKTSR